MWQSTSCCGFCCASQSRTPHILTWMTWMIIILRVNRDTIRKLQSQLHVCSYLLLFYENQSISVFLPIITIMHGSCHLYIEPLIQEVKNCRGACSTIFQARSGYDNLFCHCTHCFSSLYCQADKHCQYCSQKLLHNNINQLSLCCPLCLP